MIRQYEVSRIIHKAKLEELDGLPRPRNWEDEGSAEYRKEAIRILDGWLEKGECY